MIEFAVHSSIFPIFSTAVAAWVIWATRRAASRGDLGAATMIGTITAIAITWIIVTWLVYFLAIT